MTMRRVFLFEYLSASAADPAVGAEAELHAEGLAMRDALHADLATVPGWVVSVAGKRTDTPPNVVTASTTQPLCARPGEAPADFIARMARQHDLVWVVAPETGGLLAALHDAVPRRQWIGCDGASIRLASSKQATLAHLQARDLATPRNFEHDPDLRHWVVKPDDGAGSLRTRRYADRSSALADQLQRQQRGETATLEPWVDGDAMSLSLLVRHDEVELLAVNRQRLAIDAAGAVSLTEVVIAICDLDATRRAALGRTARAVANAIPGLAGWVGVDLVWHAERGPVVIEVNPRVTSAWVGMSTALGRPLAAEILAAHLQRHPFARAVDTNVAR